MSGEKILPKGWQLKKLGMIAKWGSGGTPTSTNPNYYDGEIPWLIIGDLNDGDIISSEKKITKLGLKNSSARIVEPNSVLIAMYGSIGKLGINKIPVATNQAIAFTIELYKEVNNKYLFYYLLSIRSALNNLGKGATQKNISQTVLKEVDFPMPPLSEQIEIVTKIEELFSKLENGKKQLEIAQKQLKVYRQSILKWGFENDSFQKYILKDVTEKIQIGPFGTQLHKQDYIENGIPLINPMHIKGGNIEANYSYSITKEKRNSLPNYILNEGDVIMGRRGEMGRCGLVRKKESGWFCGTGSLYFRPKSKKLNSLFLYYYLSSQPVKKHLNDNAGGTTMANLNLKIVNNIPISLPPVKQQELIVNELESKLTICDKIEETLISSLRQADSLRQSILMFAFQGKLISQSQVIETSVKTLSVKAEKPVGKPVQLISEEFPKIKMGLTTTDLHAGILAMVIDAHEKSPQHLAKLNHVKGEKIAHLIEYKLGISLGRVPMKDAAGPDDYNHLKKVEHRANKAGFFKTQKLAIGHTYKSLRGLQAHITKTKSALSKEEFNAVNSLIQTFLKFEMEHAEVIATLYAGWNNLLIAGKAPKDEEIVYESRENWSKRKLTIDREKFFKTLTWMKQHDFVPEGKGTMVLKKEEISKKAVKKKKKLKKIK